MPQKKKKKPQKRRTGSTSSAGSRSSGRHAPIDLAQLSELKMRMITNKSFAASWDFFLDQFGERPGFMELGQETQNDMVDLILESMAQELYGPSAKVNQPRMREISEHNFIHGGCFLHKRFGALFYFTDLNQGILALPASRPSEETLFMRLTGYVVKGTKDGPPNVVIPKTDYVQ